MKVARLLALRAGRLNPQDHNAAERIKSMKNPFYPNRIQTASFQIAAQYLNQLAIAYRHTC